MKISTPEAEDDIVKTHAEWLFFKNEILGNIWENKKGNLIP